MFGLDTTRFTETDANALLDKGYSLPVQRKQALGSASERKK